MNLIPQYQNVKGIKFAAVNLFVFFASLYLFSASGLNFYETDAAQLRFAVVKSIIEKNDVNVPEEIGMRGADGRYYSWLGIGSALVSIPFYMVSSILHIPAKFIIQCLPIVFAAATAVIILLFVISLRYSSRTAILIALFYGLGTFAWPLSKQPFDHTMETFFVLLSIFLMYLYSHNRKTPLLLISALSFGFAFITRLTSLLILPSLFILMIYNNSKNLDAFKKNLGEILNDILLFCSVLIPFICLNCYYNYYRFGSIFETGYSLLAARTGLNFFGGTPLLTGLSGLLFSPGKGYFYYSPIAILFFPSFILFIQKHRSLGLALLLLIISYLLFISKNIYWHGDWAWGPRYILVLTPFFIIPLAGLIDSLASYKKIIKNIVYLIFSVSLAIQIAAISVDFQKYFFYLRYDENVKFEVASGSGVQNIQEPPKEVYFDCHYSPILKQFAFIYEIARGIRTYRYAEPMESLSVQANLKRVLSYNVFDFWWLYHFFIFKSYFGIVLALMLIIIIIFSALRLRSIAWDQKNEQ